MEASRIQRAVAAIQSVDELGMRSSIAELRMAADEEVWAAAAETSPRSVAGVANEGLDDEAAQGGGEPEQREAIRRGSEDFIDGAHVGQLQAEAELDAEKAEGHVPDLPENCARGLSMVFLNSRECFELAGHLSFMAEDAPLRFEWDAGWDALVPWGEVGMMLGDCFCCASRGNGVATPFFKGSVCVSC